jgi:hypothetical protein
MQGCAAYAASKGCAVPTQGIMQLLVDGSVPPGQPHSSEGIIRVSPGGPCWTSSAAGWLMQRAVHTYTPVGPRGAAPADVSLDFLINNECVMCTVVCTLRSPRHTADTLLTHSSSPSCAG